MEESAVIDRFVDDTYAVLLIGDDETECVVPIGRLPDDARPGSWLRVRLEGDELVEAVLDVSETDRARARIEEKMRQLRARGRKSR